MADVQVWSLSSSPRETMGDYGIQSFIIPDSAELEKLEDELEARVELVDEMGHRLDVELDETKVEFEEEPGELEDELE